MWELARDVERMGATQAHILSTVQELRGVPGELRALRSELAATDQKRDKLADVVRGVEDKIDGMSHLDDMHEERIAHMQETVANLSEAVVDMKQAVTDTRSSVSALSATVEDARGVLQAMGTANSDLAKTNGNMKKLTLALLGLLGLFAAAMGVLNWEMIPKLLTALAAF